MLNTTGNQSTLFPPGPISIPKNRSTGNLPNDEPRPTGRIRFSVDGGQLNEPDRNVRSPILLEHEHGLGVSGLRRIRQHPPSRAPTLPPSPSSSFVTPSRASSMTLNLMSARSVGNGGPTSPTLNFNEDLSRFPSESLHSFSFAQQSEDLLHDRQAVVRKSIEFMRDRGWAVNHAGLVKAQAKITGDVEVQSMLELLDRAHMLGDKTAGVGLGVRAPLTGPAIVDGENVFERQFMPRSETPDQADDASSATAGEGSPAPDSRPESSLSRGSHPDRAPAPHGASSVAKSAEASAVRIGLTRTYTDTGPLKLQTKLVDALAKPYKAGESAIQETPLLPDGASAVEKPLTVSQSSLPSAHGHGPRWTPAAQAIFTTEAHAPWTILAANDLACLVFGVTRAEVRKLGMLEMVRPDWRAWLEEKLSTSTFDTARSRSPITKSARSSPTASSSLTMRGGITAKLLSKPSSREQKQAQRRRTDDGSGSSRSKSARNHAATQSRGVLICGDVLPILKRNGSAGSASLWVKEKKSSLIWVVEEIVEDVAHLTLDETGSIISAAGAVDVFWGERANVERHGIRELIPRIPLTPKLPRKVDYGAVGRVKHYTARSPEGYNLPVSIGVQAALGEITVSSFPHIAGILVLSSQTLCITSSNSVFSAALFGQPDPDGLHITELIPQFAKLLALLVDEDKVDLFDGIVIPEHSFRRARALLTLREGHADAATIFLRPTGLGAKHRDGSDINIDVQMRVVKSETPVPEESVVIEERSEESDSDAGAGSMCAATSESVYALWITYSRHLHSVRRPGGPASPLMSRPGTPPRQPSPGQSVALVAPEEDEPEEDQPRLSPSSLLTAQIQEATAEPISAKPPAQVQILQSPAPPKAPHAPRPLGGKKSISDFIILEEMGQGAYGQVRLARYKRPAGGSKVVLKYVTKKRILVDTWTRDRRLGTVPLEIHVLDYLRRDGLKHPNVVEMIDFFEDSVNYYIEMVPHGLPGMDLFDYIEMRTTMDEAECRNIFLQVVAALHHLHVTALVVHRDIKDENIILDGENHVKLIDFGSAAYIKNGPFDVFVGTIGEASPFLWKYT